MAIVISATNNKGGPGKTTTITQVSQVLAKKMRKKVLLLDLDWQCNLSQAILGQEFKENTDIGELFDPNSKIDIETLIVKQTKTLHILPGHTENMYDTDLLLDQVHHEIKTNIKPDLEDVLGDFKVAKKKKIQNAIKKLDDIIVQREERIFNLKKRISEISMEYDYIFIDLPRSMSGVTESSWVASDYLLVPISDNFALKGTETLVRKMTEIKREYNDDLQFLFFFNKVPLSSNLFGKNHVNKEYAKLMEAFIGAIEDNEALSSHSYIMESVIRESKDIEKSYGRDKSLLSFKEANVLGDYVDFAKDLHKICKK